MGTIHYALGLMIVLAGPAVTQCANAADAATAADTAGACKPLETREPNATGQRPAFSGQTRVCAIKSSVAFDVVVLAKGLSHPWAVEPLPDGALYVVTDEASGEVWKIVPRR